MDELALPASVTSSICSNAQSELSNRQNDNNDTSHHTSLSQSFQNRSAWGCVLSSDSESSDLEFDSSSVSSSDSENDQLEFTMSLGDDKDEEEGGECQCKCHEENSCPAPRSHLKSVPAKSSSGSTLPESKSAKKKAKQHENLRKRQQDKQQQKARPRKRLPWRILLVRHGESEANVNRRLYTRMADHAIPLTARGKAQAREAGAHVREYLEQAMEEDEATLRQMGVKVKRQPKVRLWVSPYKRTRETAECIAEACRGLIYDQREHVNLTEQQFGLFEGLTPEEIVELHPNEYEHYSKAVRFGGRFWARMPMGESRFDVCRRVHEAFGSFHRDREYHGIRYMIVVTHGVTLRSFVMMWSHQTPEWLEKETNPLNCAVRVLDKHGDRYIFDGGSSSVSFSTHQERVENLEQKAVALESCIEAESSFGVSRDREDDEAMSAKSPQTRCLKATSDDGSGTEDNTRGHRFLNESMLDSV